MSELRDKKELYELWDSLYKKLKTIDEAALLLEQNIKHASSKEAIQGYLASIGLSMIKDLYMQNTGSIGFLLSVRCIIEGLAVYLYIEKETVSEEQNEIFKLQSYFIEKKIYTRYPDLDGVLFDLNQINENFENTIQLISTKFDFSSIQIKELLKSKIPFLGNVKSFEKLIREYLDNNFLVFYKSISLFVHPYDYRLKDSNLCTSYAIAAFKMLEFLFQDVKPSQIGLESEYNRVIGYNEFGFQARKITHLQREKLHKLSKLLDESNMVFLAFSIYESSMILIDYLLDISFGNTEQCTIKWKTAIENLWVFDLCLKDEVFARKNELLFYHSQLKNKQNLGIELNNQDFIDAFRHYQIKYLNGCNFDLFKKRFSSLTGYTINEKGQTISLKTAIYTLIEDLSKNINEGTLECLVQQEPYKIPTEEDYKNKTSIQIGSFLKMKYDESQAMSHASGYLYNCLSGAWYDGNILGYLYDELLQVLLKQLLVYLKSEYSKKRIDKVLINYLRNFLKYNDDCILKKKQLYLMPKVKKNY